jgi:hypothetical protein
MVEVYGLERPAPGDMIAVREVRSHPYKDKRTGGNRRRIVKELE